MGAILLVIPPERWWVWWVDCWMALPLREAARAPVLRTAPKICQACWATSTWKRCARMLQREQLDKCRCPFLTVTFNPLMPFPGTGCGACIYIYMYILLIDYIILHWVSNLATARTASCIMQYHTKYFHTITHTYTHIHTHIHIHIYIYIYLFIYAHTHTHTRR